MSLVSKYFHRVALEYLYSSFLICSCGDYARVSCLVQRPGVAPCVKRLTVDRCVDSPTGTEITFQEFLHCPNLHIYVDFEPRENAWLAWTAPPIMGPTLTVLEINNVTRYSPTNRLEQMVCSLGTCTSLRILRIIRVSAVPFHRPPLPCILPRLELLEIQYKRLITIGNNDQLVSEWLPSITLPRLHTLLIGVGKPPIPALLPFSSSLTTLALGGTPKLYGSSAPLPMPQLRRFLAYHHPRKSQWGTLPDAIAITGVEHIEIRLNEEMWQAFGQTLELPWDPKHCADFAALLAILLDPVLTPSLIKVTFDVNPRTKAAAWAKFRSTVAAWQREMHNRRPSVWVQSVFYDTKDDAWRCVAVTDLVSDQVSSSHQPLLCRGK